MKRTIKAMMLSLAFLLLVNLNVYSYEYSMGTQGGNTSIRSEYVISTAPAQAQTSDVDLSNPVNDSLSGAKQVEKITPEQKKELKDDIWGIDKGFYDYLPAFLFAFMGMFLRWFWSTSRGIKSIQNQSPAKFDLIYWIKDNILSKLNSFMASIIVIFVGLRFSNELLDFNFSMFLALCIGLLIDYVSDLLKNLQPFKKVINNTTDNTTTPNN